jgi:hypothetical protein
MIEDNGDDEDQCVSFVVWGEFCDPAAVAHAISLRILCVVVEVVS